MSHLTSLCLSFLIMKYQTNPAMAWESYLKQAFLPMLGIMTVVAMMVAVLGPGSGGHRGWDRRLCRHTGPAASR